MSRRLLRLAVHALVAVGALVVFSVLAAATGAWKASPASAAPNTDCSVNSSGDTATILLSGGRRILTLNPTTGVLQTNSGTNGNALDCTFNSGTSNGQLGKGTDGGGKAYITNINFDATTSDNQTVELNESAGYFPCITQFEGFMSSLNQNTGTIQIDGPTVGPVDDFITVGSDGLDLNATSGSDCGSEKQPSNVGSYVLVGSYFGTLSAQGQGGTSPTSLPVKFVAGSQISSETFLGGSGTSTLDMSNTVTPATSLIVNTTSSSFGANNVPASTAYLYDGANLVGVYGFSNGASSFTNFIGSSVAATTYAAGNTTGYSFSVPGSPATPAAGSTLDLSAANTKVTADLSNSNTGTVTLAGSATPDTLTNIYQVVAPPTGNNKLIGGPNGPYVFTATGNGNTFVGGAGQDTFSAPGANNTFQFGTGQGTVTGTTPSSTGDVLDFSAVGNNLSVNVSGATVLGTLANYNAQAGTTTYNFGALSPIAVTVKGATNPTTFYAGSTLGYNFQGASSLDTVDLTNAGSAIKADLSTVPNHVTISGSAGSDILSGIDAVKAAQTGDEFIGGASATPLTFTDTASGVTFKAGSGNETFDDSATGNTYDFSALSVPLTVNVVGAGPNYQATTSAATYTLKGLKAPANILGSTGGTTFKADNGTTGYSFTGEGGTTVADFSASSVGVIVDMHLAQVTVTLGAGTDTLQSIFSVIGSTTANNTFVAGSASGTETFGDLGTGKQDILDFSNVGTSNTSPLAINVSGAPVSTALNGTVVSYTAALGNPGAGGVTYNFTNSGNGTDFVKVIGSGFGNTVFLVGNVQGAPAYTLCASTNCTSTVVPSDTIDFSSVQTSGGNGLTVDLSGGPPGTGTATLPSFPSSPATHVVDSFVGFVSVIGANTGLTTFMSGPTSTFTYTFTGLGNSNDFVAGDGSANFISSGSNNTVDFSHLSVAMTINLSGTSAQSVLPGTAAPTGNPGGATYTFTSFAAIPTTFIGALANTTFFAGSTGDKFFGKGGFNNTLSFANASGSSLVFCNVVDPGSTVPACSTGNGLTGSSAVLGGSVLEPFSNIINFVGLPTGNTTFEGDDASSALVFTGSGSNNSANFALATNGVKFDFTQSPLAVTFSGGGTDHLSGVTSVTGSKNGHNTFVAGTSSESFGAGGTGNAIDFTAVATSAPSPLTINTTSTTFNGVAAFTAATSSASYSFATGAAGFVTFIGASGGNTDFVAPNTLAGGYQFCPAATYATASSPPTCTTGVVPSNVVDFSAVQTSSGAGNGLTLDLSSVTIGTGTATLPGGGTDHFFGIVQAIGAGTGFTTFKSGPVSAFTYKLTGQGNSNDFIAGSGSAIFTSSGTNNTVDFSQLSVGMTVNLSSSTAQGVAPGTASPTSSPGSVVYTFTSFAANPATFKGANADTIFFAGSTADEFDGVPGHTNTLSFANAAGTSLVFCNTVDSGSTVPLCSTANGLTGKTAVLNGTGLEPFSNITVFVGLPGGNTTFESGDGEAGFVFQGSGSNNSANFALATNGVKFDLTTLPVVATLSNGFTDQLGNVTSVIGSRNGGNTFIAGTSSETFGAGGTGNSIDFTAVPTSGGAPLTVNTSTTSVNGVAPDTAATSSATYTFTNGGSGFVTFIGSGDGNTRFVAPRALTGGLSFCYAATYASAAATPSCTTPDGAGHTDTADFSAITSGGITVTMLPGTNYGTVALGGGTCASACDYIYGITNVIGSATTNVFNGGLDGNNFTSSSTSNTLSYLTDQSSYTNGVTIDLITNSVTGSCVISATSSCGDTFSFPSGALRVQGSPSSDTFVLGSRAVASLQGGGGQDAVNLASITPSGGAGVSVNLVLGSITGPSIGGISFATPPVADAVCGAVGEATDLCISNILGTTGNDVFKVNPESPSLQITGNGGSVDTLDLGAVSSVQAVVNMPLGNAAGTATASGSGVSLNITFFGISALSGTSFGGDHIFVGTGTETFTEVNSGNLGTLDYSALSHFLGCQQNVSCTYSGPGVTVTTNDISGGFSGSTSSPVTVGAQDAFSNIGRFIGTGGNDTFAQNGASPASGYFFDGLAGTDTLDLTGTGVTLTVSLSSSACGTGNDGTATGTGVNDSFRCISTVKGSSTLYQINPGQAVNINGGGTGILQLVGDTVANGGGTNGVTIDLGTHTITGDNYNITFSGMQTIYGTPYQDTFVDGPGSYTLIGGGGTDGLDFTNANSAVEANLSSRPYLIPNGFANAGTYLAAGTVTGGDGGTLLISGINNIVGTEFFNDLFIGGAGYGNFIGGTGADRFVIFGGGVDRIYGGSGGSTLDLTQLPSPVAYLDLSNPSQQFLGGSNGFLTVVPGTITTVIAPSSGSDIYAGSGSITLVGGTGTDILSAGSGSQTLLGGGGNDFLVGGINGSDTLQGGSAPVTFIPGSGNDTLISSGTGNTLSYDGVVNPVFVNLSNQPYTVPGNVPFAGHPLAANTASGGNGATVSLSQAGISNVIGSYGSDIFVTGANGNQIVGNGGNDLFVITASTVGNTLTAAAGSHSWFLFVGNSSNTISGGGASTVDFSQVDSKGSPVTVDLVHNSATGGFGGTQSLTGILNIIGTHASGNQLTASSPGATITSLGAGDTLTAAPGGHDTLINDGPGGDTFIAAPGNGFDTMIGGVGNDRFFVRDGQADTIDGGGGFNQAQIDVPPVIDTYSNIQQFVP